MAVLEAPVSGRIQRRPKDGLKYVPKGAHLGPIFGYSSIVPSSTTMKQLIKKFKKPKNNKNNASDQDGGGSEVASNASSTRLLVTAAVPIVDTSITASSLNQAGGRAGTSSQPPMVSNKPTEGSHTESARQEVIAETSTPKPDATNQEVEGKENKPKSSEIFPSASKAEERKSAARPLGQRIRDGAIIALDFATIISDANDLLKPVKAVAGGVKKVLEITKVRDPPPYCLRVRSSRMPFRK
jgi:hypothetical protein